MIKELTFAMLKEKDGGENLRRLLATRVKSQWPYKVRFDFHSHTTEEIEDWCAEHCEGSYYIMPGAWTSIIHLESEKDATLAKLKWSYDDKT